MPKTKRPRSLRGIVFTLIGVCLASFLIVFYSLFRTTMTDMLSESEAYHVDEHCAIVNGILSSAVDELIIMAKDVAFWEETVGYVQGVNPDFMTVNWPDSGNSILESYSFNFITIKDAQGRDLYTDHYDFLSAEAMPPAENLCDLLVPIAQQVMNNAKGYRPNATRSPNIGTHGILFYEGVPYYICSMPIMTYESDAVPYGTVTFGLIMDNRFFKQLTHLGSAEFEIVDEPFVYGTDRADLTKDYVSDDELLVTIATRSIRGDNIQLRMHITRSSFAQGQAVIAQTAYLLVLMLIAFVLLLYFINARLIFRPLEALIADIESMDESGSIDLGKYGGNREFSTLGGAINDMLGRLDESNISIAVFQNILNGMDTCVYVSDPQTDYILFMNDKMIEEFGFEHPVVGKRCYELIQPGQSGRCEFCPNHTLEHDPTAVVVWEEQNAITGRYYRNTGSLIEWSDNSLMHLQHRVDITDIHLAENNLKKRLDQQELMSAVSRSFISSADMQLLINNALRMSGEFLGASRVLLSTYDKGVPHLEIQYAWYNERQQIRPMKEMYLPLTEDHILYREIITGNADHLTCDHVKDEPTFAYLWPDSVESFVSVPIYLGGRFWGSLYLDHCLERYRWSESDLQLIKLIANVISGVVQRNETEKDLLRMSSIAESTPQFVAYINEQGDFEYLNQGAAEKTGYAYEELVSGGLRMLFSNETNAQLQKDILPVIYAEGRLNFDLPVICKNGDVRIFAFTTFMTRAYSGIGIIANDITEKNELEQALIAARDIAEESSRAKGDFLSRMSHEMRTPMNAIIGMTNIAKASDDIEKKSYCLDKIDEASNHLLGVINDILDMSKIESGKFELAFGEFDLENMFRKATDVMSFKVDEKDQNLLVHLDPALPSRILSDEQRLSQVMTNLLSNAVKFTPERGTIKLTATLLAEENDRVTIKVDVSDTGIGISAEQQARLFRSFEQADGGIARRYGGTGLGLAISRSIVEMLGGRIWVNAKPGEGSTFSFVIDARKAPGADRPKGLLGADVNWGNLRILAVDDAAEVRTYFSHLSGLLGITCRVAGSSREACDLLEAQSDETFHIVFVDWRMPDMDGLELARLIKARYGPGTVVIMVSAAQWSDIETEARGIGIDKFLPKPLYSSLIIDCINECLGIPRGNRNELQKQRDYTDHFANYHILLAEDMEINREILIGLLEHTGVTISIAENGRQVSEMFAADPDAYDMIFMDIHMPEVDGYEATRTIRALDIPKGQTIPIIAMTANVFREDVERCLAAGMDDHIGKPIDLGEIITKLQKYLPIK